MCPPAARTARGLRPAPSWSSYQAVARLRLAAELLDAKAYDEALKQLAGSLPKEFEPLAADRKGDIHLAQGKRDEARAEYQKAWSALRCPPPTTAGWWRSSSTPWASTRAP